jgi:acyl carrier protein
METTPQASPAPELQADVIELLGEVVSWDLELDEPMHGETQLVADLGFQSLDIVMLIVAIEGRYQRQNLPFDELLMVDGQYVSDLSVRELSSFLDRHIGGGVPR